MLEAGERQLIGDGARDLLERAGGISRARRRRDANGLDEIVWAQMAALGWFGMTVPEACGGSALRLFDTLELFQALGAGLAPEPVVPVIAATFGLARAGTAEAHALLGPIMQGTLVPPFIPAPDASAAPAVVAGRLNGRTGMRPDIRSANGFIFTAHAEGGTILLSLAADQPGIDVETIRTIDGGAIGCLNFRDVDVAAARPLACGPAAETALREAAEIERLGHAAVLVGLMDRVLTLSVEHLRTRHQFDAPIGSFQALQHRAASMHVDVASSRSLVREASRAVDSPRQGAAAAAAKAYVSAAATRTTLEAIQFHGAVGFTDEHDVGLFHRRAMALAAADGGIAAARAIWLGERRGFDD